VTDVVAEVEVRVVDPDRPSLPVRHEGELLAEARNEVQARVEVLEELLVARRGAFEDRRRGHVHVSAVALEMQERGVESAQSVDATSISAL
jgi:hypothetical protein